MNVAIIFAGGVGSRMGKTAKPKQFLEIYGRPIIVRTLDVFSQHPEIDAIAVSILKSHREEFEELVDQYRLHKVRWIIDGGATGQESRHNALKAVAQDCGQDTTVLIHDGVRPFIDERVISENIQMVAEKGNAITCSKVNQTIVQVEQGEIQATIPRDSLYMAQAPQSFNLGEILSLYDRAVAEGEHDSIDSCSLMRRYERPTYMLKGPSTNIKVTEAEDFHIAKTFYNLLEAKQLEGLI